MTINNSFKKRLNKYKVAKIKTPKIIKLLQMCIKTQLKNYFKINFHFIR